MVLLGTGVFSIKYQETTLYFGEGALEKARGFFTGLTRVGIVTGARSAELSGALRDVLKILEELNISYTIFNEVTPNPFASQAERAAERFWREGVDAIVAIGGGSVIDTAKIASVIVVSGRRVKDLVAGYRPRGSLPLLAVNLTHGTGTEVDRYAVATLDDTREKHGLSVKYPDTSVDDPRYTLTLSREQTIYTTLDAFYHAYEAATSTSTNPFVETLSTAAASIIASTLPLAVKDLGNLQLRSRLLYASMLAGISIDLASTHINHAIEHALSGLKPELPHGAGLAMLGPRVVYYTHKARPAESASIVRHVNPYVKPIAEDAERAMKAVASFQESVGFKERLSNYGFTEQDVAKVVEYALKRLSYMTVSTPFPVAEDVVKDIFTSAL
ncbi:MAG: iron-containing alcohol dehydrogenase [Desulfurococcaceae archaeon]